MFKKVLLVGALVTLTGCATQQQNGQMLGAMVGYAVGSQIGGGMGNVAATAIGTAIGLNAGGAIGASMDRPAQVIYVQDGQRTPSVQQYTPAPAPTPATGRSRCYDYSSSGERNACMRGIEAEERRLQRQREKAAFRAGQTYAR
jgi:outer membrane lipoprotein SlyB